MASRLSEDSDVTVALLEAGKDSTEYPLSGIPLAVAQLQNSEADWAYRTTPQQKSCQGMHDKVTLYIRGRPLIIWGGVVRIFANEIVFFGEPLIKIFFSPKASNQNFFFFFLPNL